jgi:hypothetical protein
VQIFNYTAPVERWFKEAAQNADFAFSPHSRILQARQTPPGTTVDCAQYAALADMPADSAPALEDILCGLVLADNPAAEGFIAREEGAAWMGPWQGTLVPLVLGGAAILASVVW